MTASSATLEHPPGIKARDSRRFRSMPTGVHRFSLALVPSTSPRLSARVYIRVPHPCRARFAFWYYALRVAVVPPAARLPPYIPRHRHQPRPPPPSYTSPHLYSPLSPPHARPPGRPGSAPSRSRATSSGHVITAAGWLSAVLTAKSAATTPLGMARNRPGGLVGARSRRGPPRLKRLRRDSPQSRARHPGACGRGRRSLRRRPPPQQAQLDERHPARSTRGWAVRRDRLGGRSEAPLHKRGGRNRHRQEQGSATQGKRETQTSDSSTKR
ncbi:hypothetical protein BASA60_001684 [Batrachochytrium salamandrivorans]|nr:hypothetical protein BASA60_001684 [Batrachochytrium salamandrivorans]